MALIQWRIKNFSKKDRWVDNKTELLNISYRAYRINTNNKMLALLWSVFLIIHAYP